MLDVVELGPKTASKREAFFKLILGNSSGLFCLAFISAQGDKFTEEFYQYPNELAVILRRIDEMVVTHNVYFCSQLLRERRRVKENVEQTPNVWADLDSCPPERMLVEPSVVLETSKDSYQAFWVMDKDGYDPDEVEEICRRISYRHKGEGADNGWALTKLLRVPYTYNFKYTEAQVVKVRVANRLQYSLESFNEYPVSNDYIKVDIPVPPEELLDVRAEDILQQRRNTVNPMIWQLFTDEPKTDDWSRTLWKLLTLLHENEFSSEEVYVIAREASCNKYARDGRPAIQLWKDVCRAKARVELAGKLLIESIEKPTTLISEEERKIVEDSYPTFIERFIKWASKLSDAPQQYHQAGALVALSSFLAGSVRLPTSYGTIIPNLWFMILADTTLTRKTTAMDIAMDLIFDINDDIVMATDGSIEGLLTSLSARPNQPSIFLRDEFSGLLEQMTKKDYMAGMPELLTKLYDCKMQKRVLRKDTVEVRDPRLIIFAGGIKNRITSILSQEHISSGFLPRFVFITAESDTSKIKPIGPPTPINLEERTKILTELENIERHYNQTKEITIQQHNTTATIKVTFDAEMTSEAWLRYNILEAKLIQEGQESDNPDIMIPIGDRLAKSILKSAMLIAASRQFTDEVVIEEIDILRAAKYGEEWIKHSKVIATNIGKGTNERLIDKMMRKIAKSENGVPRSTLMQVFHLSARDANFLIETLDQRGLITTTRQGKLVTIYATNEGKLNAP